MTCTDEEALSDALWAVSYMTDGDDDRIRAVMATGVAIKVVGCLVSPSSKIKLPALRSIGNIVTGADDLTQEIVNIGALPMLGQLVTAGTKQQERKEACWAISNIAAGTPAQLSAVLSSGVMLPVTHALQHGEFDVKKEACWAVCNAVHGSVTEQVQFIVEQYNTLGPMCDMLSVSDPKMVTITLDFLENVLKAGQKVSNDKGGENKMLIMLDEAGGVDKLEELQEHSNHDIYQKAVRILETYVGEEDEEDGATIPATCADGQQFAFGMGRTAAGALEATPAFTFA